VRFPSHLSAPLRIIQNTTLKVKSHYHIGVLLIIRVIHTLGPKVGRLVSCFGLPRLVGPKVGRLVSCFSLPWLVGPVSWLARLMLIVGSDSWQNRLLLLA